MRFEIHPISLLLFHPTNQKSSLILFFPIVFCSYFEVLPCIKTIDHDKVGIASGYPCYFVAGLVCELLEQQEGAY
jgi:hypothetical protein